jgi:ABC-type amino acid transport substrate-binding protein
MLTALTVRRKDIHISDGCDDNATKESNLMRPIIVALSSFVLAGTVVGAEPLEGRLKSIAETATLRIAYRTDSRPFAFLDAQGQPTGYTIELCERVAKSLEQQLQLPALAIEWVPVDTRTRFQVIVDGSADMECGSTSVSLSRMKLVDFSSLVFAESTGMLVKAGVGIFRFDDMAGKRIGIVPDSTNARAIRDQLAQRRLEATLVEFRDRADGIAALARGELDGFATDKLVLLALAQAANLRDYTVLPDDLSFEPFAIMLPRGDWAFRLAVNSGLARLFRSGEVIEIYTRYFSGVAQRPSVWVGAIFTFGGLPE